MMKNDNDHNAGLAEGANDTTVVPTSLASHAAPTPGPWTVNIVEQFDEYGKPFGSIAYIKADTGHQEIAVMYADKDQIANARWITATPQMRALIERAVEVLQRHAPPDGLSDHDAMSEFYGIFDGPEYRAFIAKAEGQS